MRLPEGLTVADYASIQLLAAEYGWRLDHGLDVADLFVPEGIIRAPALGMQLCGRKQISEHLRRTHANPRQITRHISVGLRIEDVSGPTVHLTTNQLTCLRLPGEPHSAKHLMFGDTRDVVRRDDTGEWRFVERQLDVIFPFDVQPGTMTKAST